MGIYVFKKDVLTKLLGDKYPQVLACMPLTWPCAHACPPVWFTVSSGGGGVS